MIQELEDRHGTKSFQKLAFTNEKAFKIIQIGCTILRKRRRKSPWTKK
jgi:hypothetical protein